MSRISMVSLFALLFAACDDEGGGAAGGQVAAGDYDVIEHLRGPCGEAAAVTDCPDCAVSGDLVTIKELDLGDFGTSMVYSDCAAEDDCVVVAALEEGETGKEAARQTASGDGSSCVIKSTDFEVRAVEGGIELFFRTFQGSMDGACDFERDDPYPTDGFDCVEEEIVQLSAR